MGEQPIPKVDLERTDQYPANAPGGRLDLEATEAYLTRAKADVRRSKARAANWVALILVLGLVLSLPSYVVAIAILPADATSTQLERIFQKWYDVVSPLVGAVVGALFGLTIADRGRESRT